MTICRTSIAGAGTSKDAKGVKLARGRCGWRRWSKWRMEEMRSETEEVQGTWGFTDLGKEFAFYSKCEWKPLEGFRKKGGIRFTFFLKF